MKFLILGLILGITSCAGVKVKDTCDTYCVRTGGICFRIEQGERRYNTLTGTFEEKPTIFECRYNN